MEYIKVVGQTYKADVLEGDKTITLRFGFKYGGIVQGCVLIVEKQSWNCYIPEYYVNYGTPESLAQAIIVLGRIQDHFEGLL